MKRTLIALLVPIVLFASGSQPALAQENTDDTSESDTEAGSIPNESSANTTNGGLASISASETGGGETPHGVVEPPVTDVEAAWAAGGLVSWPSVFPALGQKTSGA